LIKPPGRCKIARIMEITVLKAIGRELKGTLPGLRLAEVDEAEDGLVCLKFKGPESKYYLVMSPRPAMPRLYVTAKKTCGSKGLTPFAQNLRNHLIGSTAVSVTMEGLERAVRFNFTRKTEKVEGITALLMEMAGKKPNIILMDDSDKIILAQSCVSLSGEALRPILPGLSYQPPPKPGRLDPFEATGEDLERIIRENPGMPIEKALMQSIGGISPLLAREVVATAGVEPDPASIFSALIALLKKVEEGPYEPCIYDTPKGPVLSALTLAQFGACNRTAYATMCEAAEAFYETVAERQKLTSLKAGLLKDVRARLAAAQRKLEAIQTDLARADRADEYQHYGNLLMASSGSVQYRAESVVLADLFSEKGETVSIPLDPKLTSIQNAEAFFKKAKKAKAGVSILQGRKGAVSAEVEGLKALLWDVEQAEHIDELLELRGGPSPKGKTSKKSRKAVEEAPSFPSFKSSDGYEVLYAKNAKANDILTFKVAFPMDMWFHTQGFHGAHVIVRNPERRPDIPLATILEAAQVAAYYSEAKKEKSVPVDYTFKKHVRKPKDPVPGQAIFTHNKTVFVEPKKRDG